MGQTGVHLGSLVDWILVYWQGQVRIGFETACELESLNF